MFRPAARLVARRFRTTTTPTTTLTTRPSLSHSFSLRRGFADATDAAAAATAAVDADAGAGPGADAGAGTAASHPVRELSRGAKKNRDRTFAKVAKFRDGALNTKKVKTNMRTYENINLDTQNLLCEEIATKRAEGVVSQQALDDVEMSVSYINASKEEIEKMRIKNIIQKYQRFVGDTGSTEVQVAVIGERIRYMKEHTAFHRKDMLAKKELLAFEHQRIRLMKYLKRKAFDKYELMLRDYNMTEEDIWEFHRKFFPNRKYNMGRTTGITEGPREKQKREATEEAMAAQREDERLQKREERIKRNPNLTPSQVQRGLNMDN